MHHYPMHIGDYQKDTAWCSMLEDCAYRRLMDYYYATERPLPNDPKKLHNICRATTPAEKKAVDSVVGHFFSVDGDTLSNHRCDQIISDYHAVAEVNRTNGKRGGRPKKKTHSVTEPKPNGLANGNPTGNPKPNPNESESKGNHKPETNNQENTNTPLRPPRGKDAGFDPLKIPLPFDSPQFVAAWGSWATHRREISKPLKATMAAKQLEHFVAIGEARAVAMINHTISKGWIGLREPDEQPTGNTLVSGRNGSGPPVVSREQQRETQQLGVISEWLAERTGVPAGGIRESDCAPVLDETNG